MATLTIRDLDDEVKQKLRERAARKGVSMEAEARAIIGDAVAQANEDNEPGSLYRKMRARAEKAGWWDDFVLPERNEFQRPIEFPE